MIKVVVSFFVLMVMISAGTVYSLKETTTRLEARKHKLSAQILKDRAAIKVLRAEMAYLSQPERLQKLSARFLALAPAGWAQMAGAVNAISVREEGGADQRKLVSFPVDEFPLLLPRKKPKFNVAKYDRSIMRASYKSDGPVHRSENSVYRSEGLGKEKQKIITHIRAPKTKKLNFYDRISLKIEENE